MRNGNGRLAQLLRLGTDRALAAESTEITDVAAQHRHMGICTLLDAAASMALTTAPQLVSSLQEATLAARMESQHGHARKETDGMVAIGGNPLLRGGATALRSNSMPPEHSHRLCA